MVTSEFKLVYKIHKLNLPDFAVHHHTEPNGIGHSRFIITDRQEVQKRFVHSVLVNKNMSLLQIKHRIIKFLENHSTDVQYILGIDPGLNTGVAFLYQTQVIDSTVVYTISGLIRWIKDRLGALRIEKIKIKIGNGYPQKRQEYITQLKRELGKSIEIFLVDESYSSKRTSNELTIHEQAAIIIAKRTEIERL